MMKKETKQTSSSCCCCSTKLLRNFLIIFIGISGWITALFDNNSPSWTSITQYSTEIIQKKQSETRPRIPHTLIFTANDDIMTTKTPEHSYRVIKDTMHTYQTAWKDHNHTNNTTNVLFLNDNTCKTEIEAAEQRLLPYYQQSMILCRIAALYNHGGYYFDVTDLYTIQPILLDNDKGVSFARGYAQASGDGSLIPSFLASKPKHPILKQLLDELLNYYVGDNTKTTGKLSLFQRAHDITEKLRVYKEINWDSMSQEMKVRNGLDNDCCSNHYVVYEEQTRVVYFFSQTAKQGVRFCCVDYLKKQQQQQIQLSNSTSLNSISHNDENHPTISVLNNNNDNHFAQNPIVQQQQENSQVIPTTQVDNNNNPENNNNNNPSTQVTSLVEKINSNNNDNTQSYHGHPLHPSQSTSFSSSNARARIEAARKRADDIRKEAEKRRQRRYQGGK